MIEYMTFTLGIICLALAFLFSVGCVSGRVYYNGLAHYNHELGCHSQYEDDTPEWCYERD